MPELDALGEGEAGLLARGDGDRTARFRGAPEPQVFPVAAVAAVDRAPPVAHDDAALRPVPGKVDHPRARGRWCHGRVPGGWDHRMRAILPTRTWPPAMRR